MISHGKTSPVRAKATAKAKPVVKVKKKRAPAASHPAKHTTTSFAPLIVEAGSRSKGSLRQLEDGNGPLVREVSQIVHAIHDSVPEPLPIVIVYREKRSSGSRSGSPFGLFF